MALFGGGNGSRKLAGYALDSELAEGFQHFHARFKFLIVAELGGIPFYIGSDQAVRVFNKSGPTGTIQKLLEILVIQLSVLLSAPVIK